MPDSFLSALNADATNLDSNAADVATVAERPPQVEQGDQTALVLRVCGSSNDGKIVRLRSAKCSIGSGAQCTLRLHSPRFQPVHCFILRGPNATVVRCWAPETLLNGRPFADAPLVPGDRLKVGPLELEVVELGRPPDERMRHGFWNWDANPAKVEEDTSPLARLTSHSTDPNELPSRPRTLPLGENSGESVVPPDPVPAPHDGAALFDTTSAVLRRREEALRMARQRNRRLIKRLRQLKAQLAKLEEVRSEDCAEPHTFGQRSGKTMGAEEADSDRRSGQLSQPNQNASPADTVEQYHADHAGISSQEEPAAPKQSKLVADEPPAQPKANAPVDLAEVFRRIGVTGQLLEMVEDETAGSSCQSGTATTMPFSAVADNTAKRSADASPDTQWEQPHPEGDDAIDAYMQQLLQRLRGSQNQSDVGEPRENRPMATTAANGLSSQIDNGPEAPTAVCRQQVGPATGEIPPEEAAAETAARALPPEKLTGLSAMREVANISAQAALSQHARRTLARTRRFKLLASLASTGCGVGLLWMWMNYGLPVATLAIGLMSLTAGVVWGIQYAILVGRLVLQHSWRPRPGELSVRPHSQANPQTQPRSPTG